MLSIVYTDDESKKEKIKQFHASTKEEAKRKLRQLTYTLARTEVNVLGRVSTLALLSPRVESSKFKQIEQEVLLRGSLSRGFAI